jgi:hypothetical protein
VIVPELLVPVDPHHVEERRVQLGHEENRRQRKLLLNVKNHAGLNPRFLRIFTAKRSISNCSMNSLR